VEVWAHDRWGIPLPEGHRFPIEKYRLLRERVAVQVGQKLRLDMAPANVHLFDSASGQRLG